MKLYTKDNYLELLELLINEYGFNSYKIHDNIHELCIEESPIMRLLYEEETGLIAVSFHILISGPQSILLFDFIRNAYKKIGLADSYYEDDHGVTHTGEGANIAYEADREADLQYMDDVQTASEEYKPNYPVTYVSRYVVYSIYHRDARSMFRNFLDRKRNIW